MIKSNYRRITVKVGSNVLARKDGTLDVTRVSSLVDEICALRAAGIQVILITSGAVACGRSELSNRDIRLDEVGSRQLYSAVGQVRLMARYQDLFASHGVAIGQVLTMKENFSTRRHYLNQRNCMMVMLDNDIVPVVNENDTVSVTELMFTDNDELSGLVAAMMDCQALVILSNIDGIYDGDPSSPDSRLIRTIQQGSDVSQYIMARRSGFGRGGMVTKYRIARMVADEGIRVIIANGKRDNILTDLLLSDVDTPCTTFDPTDVPKSNIKRWMAHSDGFVKGAIVLDSNAVKAITAEKAASVLPVGVTSVSGDFDKDELIMVKSPDGQTIGIGRSAYSYDEACKVIGKHDCRPIIHYDHLYLYNL